MPPSPRFGSYLRGTRERLRSADAPEFSLRQVALRVGVEPAYLSKIERGAAPPPSEATIAKLAADLELDADVLLALAGKVSAELQAVIRRRPQLWASLIRELKSAPDQALLRVVREVRDGRW